MLKKHFCFGWNRSGKSSAMLCCLNMGTLFVNCSYFQRNYIPSSGVYILIKHILRFKNAYTINNRGTDMLKTALEWEE